MATPISAALVKELREQTGAGMMECKKALEACDGNIERATEELRKWGITKAGKKAGRTAAEGIVVIANDGKQAAMVEINSETDFVARDINFTTFAKAVAEVALANKVHEVADLSVLPLAGHTGTVEEARQALITKVGENVQIRRITLSHNAPAVGTYVHSNRIGVIVEVDADQPDFTRDVAMHIAASRPLVVTPDQVSP
ncbi:MAG TPA: translation elongation factor Ts, partial [Gammaproteobacteria bacterium]|nr:translation elongation factor Ts [Gammaproteobacteria bacterium]